MSGAAPPPPGSPPPPSPGGLSSPSPSPSAGTSILHRNLSSGFDSLAERRRPGAQRQQSLPLSPVSSPGGEDGAGSGSGSGSGSGAGAAAGSVAAGSVAAGPAPPCVAVRFVDPSTTSASAAAAAASSAAASASASASDPSGTPPAPGGKRPAAPGSDLGLYSKLTAVLSEDYGLALRGVPYRSLRTGTAEAIDLLPIRPFLSGAGGRDAELAVDPSAAAAPGSGSESGTSASAGAAADPSPSDPAQEWHRGPYCHVYLAACRDLDHYRARVRPALQAFVSQVGGAGSGNVGGIDGGGGAGGGKKGPGGGVVIGGGSGGGSATDQHRMAAAAAHIAAGAVGAGNHSSQYLIVYVPIPGAAAADRGVDEPQTPVGKAGMGLRKRLSLARSLAARSGGAARGDDGSSGGGGDDDDATAATASSRAVGSEEGGPPAKAAAEGSSLAAAAAPPPGPIVHTSKLEKELLRKFCSDFPHGRTVILSTLLSSGDGAEAEAAAATSPLKNQEFKTLLQALGSAIVDGLSERVARYDEELRRLNTLRAASTAPSQPGGTADEFDMANFFLIKESLAFTYDQMQLPAEALLQYEELGAIVPEGKWSFDSDPRNDDVGSVGGGSVGASSAGSSAVSGGGKSSGSSVLADASSFGMSDVAHAGDTVGFRARLRRAGGGSLPSSMAYLTHQYLAAREIHLLFRTGDPVEIIRRSHRNTSRQYQVRLERVAMLAESLGESATKVTRGRAEAEAWALGSCWDVKCAADRYFSFVVNAEASMSTGQEEDGNPHRDPEKVREERDAACELSDLLSFARLRLLRLGDMEFDANPVRDANIERPQDTKRPWEGWKDLVRARKDSSFQLNRQTSDGAMPADLGDLNVSSAPGAIVSETPENSRKLRSGMSRRFLSRWLRNAFTSPGAYTNKYLELTSAVIALNTQSGRHRFAAQLLGEKAEFLMLQNEYKEAAQILLSIANVFSQDHWDVAHYWRLFRLAYAQRMVGDCAPYLNTLTRCFGPRLATVAPAKTANLLQSDLEAVVGEREVSDYRLGVAPFLDMNLSVQQLPGGKNAQPLGFLRKKVIKNICHVGEKIRASLMITSHLPRPIMVDKIRLLLLTSDRYEAIHTAGDGFTEEEDSFRILTIEGSQGIEPGENDFAFEWIPMTIGQYILATVEVQWKEASFAYDSSALRKPIQSIQVLPSEPTQRMELNPLFLIPGHVQQVRLTFNSGADNVKHGSVELTCSDGIKVCPPGTDVSDGNWCDNCTVALGACKPHSEVVIQTSVKSAGSTHYERQDGIVQTIKARVNTSYHHSLYQEIISEKKEPESDPMTTLLEAMVTTLDRPALTVSRSTAHFFDKGEEENIMVSIVLHCNTPVPFFLKEWNLEFPEFLEVAPDGDLNDGMFGHAVAEGEELFFAFKCMRSEKIAANLSQNGKSILHVVLKDEFGKTFRQVLPLDLDSIFKSFFNQDEYASMNTAMAELTCSGLEGVVGTPIKFTFDFDLSTLTSLKRGFSSISSDERRSSSTLPIVYTIICDETCWILCGRVQGVVDRNGVDPSKFQVEFVGIPTQSGVIKRWPEILLEYDSSLTSAKAPPITVNVRYPEFFNSLAYTHHAALAYTSLLEA